MTLEQSRFVNQEFFEFDDLEIEERWIIKEMRSIYDGYAHIYNEKGSIDKRSYTADLMNLLNGISIKIRSLSDEIDSKQKTIFWKLDTFNQSLWDRKFENITIQNRNEIENNLKKVKISIDAIVSTLKEGTDYVNEENGELSILKRNYKIFIESLDQSERLHSKHFNHLQRLFDKAINHSKISLQIKMLNEVIDEIVYENYPDSIPVFENLDEIKKQRLRENSSGYGIHQENEAWVKETYLKIKKESDLNKSEVVRQVQKLYKKKFGKIISDSQIYRYADVY